MIGDVRDDHVADRAYTGLGGSARGDLSVAGYAPCLRSGIVDASTQRREALRRAAQELLDRWYPGTAVTVDWTGDACLVQLARGYRLAEPIWVRLENGALDADLGLVHELLESAWRLAHDTT